MSRRRQEGITLLEILVVMVILVLISGGASMAFGALLRTNLRSGCMRLMSAYRFAYGRAASHGTTVRVLLDSDRDLMSVEEAEGTVALMRREKSKNDDKSSDAEAAIDPWQAAKDRLKDPVHPVIGASPFHVVESRDGKPLKQAQPRPLSTDIQIIRMFLPHEPDVREHGKGAVHFFPNGMTEHALIQLAHRRTPDTIYTVELHPLTAKSKVHTKAVEPQDISASEIRDTL